MKRILFLCPYPQGESPSQRFRFEQYFHLLDQNGFIYEIRSFLNPSDWIILYKKGNSLLKIAAVLKGFFSRLKDVATAGKFDFIFIHREASPIGPPIIEWMLKILMKKKIIYDFDDAIWLSNTSEENKIIASLKWNGKVKSICRWSYKVSCGNSYLGDYARNFNSSIVINPTTIDTEKLHNPKYNLAASNSPAIIGWTGSHSTLPYLIPILPIIDLLWQKYPQLQLVVIADRDPDWKKPFIKFVQWNKETEIEELQKINIGIMPLTNDPWAKGKCGLKALQYMSLGIPTLASPIGVNRSIIDTGINGYLCADAKEWEARIIELISHPELCRRIGADARKKIVQNYSVESNSDNFLSLFS